MATVREFLEALFPSDLDGAFIETRLIKPGCSIPSFHDSVDQFVSALPQNLAEQNGCNIYFGVHLRSRREGTKDAIHTVRCLFVDLDAKDLSGGKAEALKRLREFALLPSIIVDSGHGHHAYWLFKEPEQITHADDVQKIESYLKALATALGADLHAAELARVLRMPGTFNVKDPAAPLLATIIHFEPERQYNLSDFEFLAFADLAKTTTPKANPPGWIAKALGGLHEGNRNATFAKIVGRLHRDGWQPKDILALLLPHANATGFSEHELEQEVTGLCRRYEQGDGSEPGSEGKGSKAVQLLAFVEAEGVTFFHDQFDEPHAVLPENQGQVLKVRSKPFRRWLAYAAWQKTAQVPSQETVQTVLQVLEGKARFAGPRIELQVRVASHEGALYYDLGDGRAVRVTPEGWTIAQPAPIVFRRIAHQKPQVTPVAGGDLRLFLTLVNLRGGEQDQGRRLLLLVWLVIALVPGFPHPPLVAHGPQGAAKSSLFKMVKELLDPSAIQTLSPADNLREFVLQAAHHWFIPIDNLSTLPEWLSDALSRACTGDGFSKRELYTDTDEVILAFRRIIGLNGINLVVDKPDLLDRSILLGLDRISEDQRMEEADLWNRFNQAKPLLLGAMFDALAKALRIVPDVKLSLLPRMADFARWGVAVAQALGYTAEEFLSAYRLAIAAQHQEAISASLVAQAVLTLMDQERWEGTPSELLAALNGAASHLHIDIHSKGWPKDPNWVWRRLREVQTNLEAVGLRIERSEKADRRITIRKVGESAVEAGEPEDDAPLPQQPQQNPEQTGGGAHDHGEASGSEPTERGKVHGAEDRGG